jgi:PTS system galactitol-specific IIA component
MKISELLDAHTISLHYPAQDSQDVIAHLGNLLYEGGYVRDTFVSAAIERENSMPTGLPLSGEINAAIPHTEIEHVIKCGLGMATLSAPVIFRNMVCPDESVPVQIVFVMALDKPKAQIEMLQEIAGVLQQPETISRLMEAKDYQEVLAAL